VIDARFNLVDERCSSMTERFTSLEKRLDHRFAALERRIQVSAWGVSGIAGLLATTMVATTVQGL